MNLFIFFFFVCQFYKGNFFSGTLKIQMSSGDKGEFLIFSPSSWSGWFFSKISYPATWKTNVSSSIKTWMNVRLLNKFQHYSSTKLGIAVVFIISPTGLSRKGMDQKQVTKHLQMVCCLTSAIPLTCSATLWHLLGIRIYERLD